MEGSDQHSRWFLCSLVTSVALQNRAPFHIMKTHGLVMDTENSKMSKSRPHHLLVDPSDLILGSVKMSGQRTHGFGPDVLRLWTAMNDTDKVFGVEVDEFKECNEEIN